MDMTRSSLSGKITTRDQALARALTWIPLLSFFLVSLPAPIIFLILFTTSATTDAAALFLFLTMLGGAIGIGAGLLILLILAFYRKRWLQRLRDRLASDGITASEVRWFYPELTTAERKTLRQMKDKSPLLADSYSEILASRLMATRLLQRTKKDLLLVERRLNRVALMQGTDTTALQKDLREDQARLTDARRQASARLSETQARMQMIEAEASRDLSHSETYAMLQRLTAAQSHLPLTIEMAQIEKHALEEAEEEINQVP